jgi:hypothetical protein
MRVHALRDRMRRFARLRRVPGDPRSAAWATLPGMLPTARLMRAWRPQSGSNRVVAGLRIARDLFPFTPLGLALGIGAYAALRAFAYAELDLVWLVTGYAALGLCALAILCVIPSAILIALRLRRLPQRDALRLETQRLAATGYTLPALRFVPFVQVRWEYVSPRTDRVELRLQAGKLAEFVAFPERGQHELVQRRVFVQDPFGLARIALRARESRELWVLPHLGGLTYLPALTALAGGEELPHPMGLEDGDRLELVRYTPGDPARFIHWKVFARTQKLLVRRPERAVAVARRCAAFYIAGPDDDASAATARLALERKLLGNEWVFGTDLDLGGTTRVDQALTQLVLSVNAREHSGAGLAGFLAQVDKRGPASVIVFGPAEPGAWLDAVMRVAGRRQLRVVIGVDGVAAPERSSRWLSLLRIEQPSSGARAAALDQVMNSLGRARIQVTLLDRSTGRALGDLGRRALFRDAARAPQAKSAPAPREPRVQGGAS